MKKIWIASLILGLIMISAVLYGCTTTETSTSNQAKDRNIAIKEISDLVAQDQELSIKSQNDIDAKYDSQPESVSWELMAKADKERAERFAIIQQKVQEYSSKYGYDVNISADVGRVIKYNLLMQQVSMVQSGSIAMYSGIDEGNSITENEIYTQIGYLAMSKDVIAQAKIVAESIEDDLKYDKSKKILMTDTTLERVDNIIDILTGHIK